MGRKWSVVVLRDLIPAEERCLVLVSPAAVSPLSAPSGSITALVADEAIAHALFLHADPVRRTLNVFSSARLDLLNTHCSRGGTVL